MKKKAQIPRVSAVNEAAGSLLLGSFEHDRHVIVSTQARGDSASFYLHSQWDRTLSHSVSVVFLYTHYDTVLPDVDIGADLCCVDHAVFLDEDVVSDVQREERHPREWDRGQRDESGFLL